MQELAQRPRLNVGLECRVSTECPFANAVCLAEFISFHGIECFSVLQHLIETPEFLEKRADKSVNTESSLVNSVGPGKKCLVNVL